MVTSRDAADEPIGQRGETAEGPIVLGRYELHDLIATGGMASVHFGRFSGPGGFARTVAIKRLHPQFARDPSFVDAFVEEARVVARIRHPNVVPTLDVVGRAGELFLVMEYVHGESLTALLDAPPPSAPAARAGASRGLPPAIASGIFVGALLGLHAAHEATRETGEPLGLVHRDVSPHNLLVGVDGIARVADFGVAKASGRARATKSGQIKGKLAYMAPEQVQGLPIDRTVDVYAAGASLWEAITGQRLFDADNEAALLSRVLVGHVPLPSSIVPGVPPALDDVILRALDHKPVRRFATAREMARALEAAMPPAGASVIGEWVERRGGVALAQRGARLAEIERGAPAIAIAVAGGTAEQIGAAVAGDVPPRSTDRTIPAGVGRPSAPDGMSATASASRPASRGPRPTPIVAAVVLVVLSGVATVAIGALGWRAVAARLHPRAPGDGAATNAPAALRAGGPPEAASSPSSSSSSPPPPARSDVAPVASAHGSAENPGTDDPAAVAGDGGHVDPAAHRPGHSPPPGPPGLAGPASPRPSGQPGEHPPSPGCTPPYIRDAAGRKIYKRECL